MSIGPGPITTPIYKRLDTHSNQVQTRLSEKISGRAVPKHTTTHPPTNARLIQSTSTLGQRPSNLEMADRILTPVFALFYVHYNRVRVVQMGSSDQLTWSFLYSYHMASVAPF